MKIKYYIITLFILTGVNFTWDNAHAYTNGRSPYVHELSIQSYTPQQIRGLITKIKESLEKDQELFPEEIQRIEDIVQNCQEPVTSALLHSMVAEMYANYQKEHAGVIRQRTEIIGYEPEDMRSWSSNLFTKKIQKELRLSLLPQVELQQTATANYDSILVKKEKSPHTLPTLFDWLTYRAIEIQADEAWFLPWIAFRKQESDLQTRMLAELKYIEYKRSTQQITSSKNYLEKLDSLAQSYGEEPFVAEIRIVQAKEMSKHIWHGTSEQRDSSQIALYNFLKEQIKRYNGYKRIESLSNYVKEMERPLVLCESPRQVYPGKDLQCHLTYSNLPEVTLRIYQSEEDPNQALSSQAKEMIPKGKLVQEQRFKLSYKHPILSSDTTICITMPEVGLYVYELSNNDHSWSVSDCFYVSRLALITRNVGKQQEAIIVDYESGKPIEKAEVLLYKRNSNREYQRIGKHSTDRQGIATWGKETKGEIIIRPVLGKDCYSMPTSLYSYNSETNVAYNKQIRLSLFTDRGIYRPGQNVSFKGIAYITNPDQQQTISNETITVSLRNAEGKELSKQTFITDDYGAIHGTFTLPTQTLNGMFSLQTKFGRAYFHVEEYKRPTFYIDFLPIKGQTVFDKPVTIQGKAISYTSVPEANAQVRWTVYASPLRPLRYRDVSLGDQVTDSGNCTTDEQGNFTLSFIPTRTKSDDTDFPCKYMQYAVRVAITDSRGETHEECHNIAIGEQEIMLNLSLPQDPIDRTKIEIQPTAQTLAGELLTLQGEYTIFTTGATEKAILTGAFTTGEAIKASALRAIPSGRYRVEASVLDSHGNKVMDEQTFILYDKKDKRPPIETPIWLIEEQTTCKPGEEAQIIFGSSLKDVDILYEIFNAQGLCKSRNRIRLSDENHICNIPFTEADGEGLTASFLFVKAGSCYTRTVTIHKQRPNPKLTIRTETFRDHLQSGMKEQWRFRITDADSAAVPTQVLVGMYDASLDAIRPCRWSFHPTPTVRILSPHFVQGVSFRKCHQSYNGYHGGLSVPDYPYDQLDWQGIFQGKLIFENNAFLSRAVMKAQASGDALRTVTVEDDAIMEIEEEIEVSSAGGVNEVGPTVTTGLRKDFSETAFFYPTLESDKDGYVDLEFYVPESLTKWNVQLLATTQNLKYGYQQLSVVTNKPLMITPHLPRFLRQGDRVEISTQISNNLPQPINGAVCIEWFDPMTNQAIEGFSSSTQAFHIEAERQTIAKWAVKIPEVASGIIGCRIQAQTEQGNDGEQHLISVLPNEVLVIEAHPFYLKTSEEKHIDLRLQTGTKPVRMTLELTANPIWQAIQTLPTMLQPTDDNLISWFASYYSNILAHSIVSTHPEIRQFIEMEIAKGIKANNRSTLENNSELKNFLLQETPWEGSAAQETQQIAQLSLLLNSNRLIDLRERAYKRLIELQTEEGGWGWFKGMPSSRQLTLFVLRGISQLIDLQAITPNNTEEEMLKKAYTFLDHKFVEDYQFEKKNSKKQTTIVSPYQLNYLILRASYKDLPQSDILKEAIQYYTNAAERQSSRQSIYGKVLTARLMLIHGREEAARQILQWLKKTATISPERGQYWANNRMTYDFFVSPIDVHCLLIDLFHKQDPAAPSIDQMKQWLLSEKRTQSWASTPATTHAIYTLLQTGNNWTLKENNCNVRWGEEQYTTLDGSSSAGYLKVTKEGEEAISNAGQTITLQKKGDTPAWGAVYTQYYQNIDKLNDQAGSKLSIERMLFVKKQIDGVEQIIPISQVEQLQVGDKVTVRLVVRSKQTMDYVALKDLRGSCLEPTNSQSGVNYREGRFFYHSTTDTAEQYFFEHLPEGTFVLEYENYVTHSGTYTGGMSTIQCLYAPDFVSHTRSENIYVK